MDLTDIELGAWRAVLGYVPQSPRLFHGTIADNLRLARPAATTRELLDAVRLSGAAEIIADLPDGLDTSVGEGGTRLSGGQRQRLAIARALLRDPGVLLLDEPTAHLDTTGEETIVALLDRLAGARTIVAISHRPRLALTSDLVAVLDAGRLVEIGPPVELQRAGGAFAGLLAAWPADDGSVAEARPSADVGSRTRGRGITRMTRGPVARLVGLMSAHRRWVAAGALLGFLAIASNVALVAMSAFLVSRAAVVDNVAEIALAVTAVRVLAIGRAAFRYLERYATHVATLRILADVRVWFYAAIEPLAPARLTTRRSGDLLARIVADVETLEDFYVRVLLPPIVAVLVTAFACVLLGVFDVTLGFVLLAFLVLVGVVLPLLTRWLSREVSERSVRTRGELSAAIVDEVNGLADLIALDRADGHRATVLALGGGPRSNGGAAGPVPGIERGAGGPAHQPVCHCHPGPGRSARGRRHAGWRLSRAAAACRHRGVRGRSAPVAVRPAARREPGGRRTPLRGRRCPAAC